MGQLQQLPGQGECGRGAELPTVAWASSTRPSHVPQADQKEARSRRPGNEEEGPGRGRSPSASTISVRTSSGEALPGDWGQRRTLLLGLTASRLCPAAPRDKAKELWDTLYKLETDKFEYGEKLKRQIRRECCVLGLTCWRAPRVRTPSKAPGLREALPGWPHVIPVLRAGRVQWEPVPLLQGGGLETWCPEPTRGALSSSGVGVLPHPASSASPSSSQASPGDSELGRGLAGASPTWAHSSG